jgi:cell fate regulator YaaT (PSP1 superfamily)
VEADLERPDNSSRGGESSRYVVRYGSMRMLGVFTSRNRDRFQRGMSVIARTNRGLETGFVLCEATPDALQHLDQPPTGQILREMTDADLHEHAHLQAARGARLDVCQKHIDRLHLEMELVDLEHLFGGERIVVYYLSENRVDFRELVKLLAGEFQTRIEMRQIGARDEARLLADYGDCGKPVCCNTHLTSMPPVSMRMAKIQKATLDPTRISGRCGRLKCCLRYEYDHYEELLAELPAIGARVVTRDGTVRVLNHEILAQQLLVETEDHRRLLIDASAVLSVIGKGGRSGKS